MGKNAIMTKPFVCGLCVFLLALEAAPLFAGEKPDKLESMRPTSVETNIQTRHWFERFREKAALSASAGAEARVIFMGDSITHFWDSWDKGLPVRNDYFAKEPYNAIFFGHAGDRTQHLLWRIENGEMDGCDPSVVVLLIGTNNNLGVGDEKCEVPLGVVAVVETVRRKFPKARIVLHPIFPAIVNENDYARAMSNLINQELRKLCDGVSVIWCDFNSQFLAEDGSIPVSMMADAIHPTKAGYEIWAKNLKPVLDRALAAKPGERVEGLEDPKFPRWTGFQPTVAAAMPDGRFGLADGATKMNGWARRLMENRLRVRALPRNTKYEVVWLGDAEEGCPPVADGVKVLNCGYAGDRTQNVLWRVHMGEMNGFFANVIVLKVGDANIAAGDSADDVFAGIKACVQSLRRMQRYSKIVVLPVSGDGAVAKDVNARLVAEKWEGPVRVKTDAWPWAQAHPDTFR